MMGGQAAWELADDLLSGVSHHLNSETAIDSLARRHVTAVVAISREAKAIPGPQAYPNLCPHKLMNL